MGDGLVPVEYGDEGWRDAFENPASAQFHHRWLAALTFLAVLALAMRARIMPALRLRAYMVFAIISAQFVLGIFTLLNGVPVWLGGLHQAGAVALLASILWLLHGNGRQQLSS
jgi:cytochrome c oxidase assembly protein subunit 15